MKTKFIKNLHQIIIFGLCIFIIILPIIGVMIIIKNYNVEASINNIYLQK